MPTQIIDGFRLNAATPIDSRLVTTGTASRNSMAYKYEGLRVYDTIQKTPFVYINGDWEEESTKAVITTSGSGTNMQMIGSENYIPKITSYGTTNSIIREYTAIGNVKKIGINVPITKPVEETLHVIGNSKIEGTVKATNFVGEISGTNVTSPIIITKLTNANATGTYILKSINNTNQWVAETTGSKILIDKDTNSDKLFLVFTNDKDTSGLGNSLYIVNNGTNDLLAANAKTRQLMVGTNNTFTNPQYSFINNTGTGMYGNSTEIGLSMGGNKRIYVSIDSVSINIAQTNTVKFESTLTTINTATTLGGTLTVTGASTLNSTLTISGNTSITGSSTFTVGGSTTLNTLNVNGNTSITGSLTVNGISTLNNNLVVASGKSTTLGGTLTVGDTITGKTVVLTPANGVMGITVTTSMSTSPPNKIINTGTGLYIKSEGELRLDTNNPENVNIITFFKEGQGASLGSLSPTNRKGWIGYGSVNSNIFYIYNDSGHIALNSNQNVIINASSEVNINSNMVTTSDDFQVKGEQSRTSLYFRICAPDNTYSAGANPASTFFGRWGGDQDSNKVAHSDAWIRVDKVYNQPNWTGYYTFSTNGTFTTNYLNLKSLPTSAAGLAAGTVWRDGNNLKIV